MPQMAVIQGEYVCFFISFLLQFFLNYAESIDNVYKKLKKEDEKLHVVSVHG